MSGAPEGSPVGRRVLAGLTLLLALLAAGGVAAADVTGLLSGADTGDAPPAGASPLTRDPAAAGGEAGRAGAGAATCPVVSGGEESARMLVATASDAPSRVRVQRFDEGEPQTAEPQTVTAGTPLRVDLGAARAAQPVGVRWRGAPVTVSRIVGGSPAAAGTCEAYPHPVWHVVGFDTTLESQATLHLVNPYTIDAVVRVTFGTPEGESTLVRTDNVLVGAGEHRQLDLTELQPQHPEMAATVEVLAGRVVAQGEMVWGTTDQQPGPEGRAMLPAVPAAAESRTAGAGPDGAAPGPTPDGAAPGPTPNGTASPSPGPPPASGAQTAGTGAAAATGTPPGQGGGDDAAGDGTGQDDAADGAGQVPSGRVAATGARAGDEYTSWLVVHNPGETTASFDLSVTDPNEGAPALITETGVPAGGVVRVNLDEVSNAERYAVAIDPAGDARLNATRVTAITTADGRQDISAAPLRAPATGWALAGGSADGGVLTVANLGPQPARVDVDAGPATPDSWSGREVAAGGAAGFPLGELEGEGPVPVRVDADSPVTVGLTRLQGGADLSMWSLEATDTATWQATADPAVRRDPTLPGRLSPPPAEQGGGSPPSAAEP